MNSAIASNINGGITNQQVAIGSHPSYLMSSIEFSLTEVKTNFTAPAHQGKYLIKLNGKEKLLNNGQNKLKISDQITNSIENSCVSVKRNKEKSPDDCILTPKVQLYTRKVNGNKEKSPDDCIPTPKVQLYTGKIKENKEKSPDDCISTPKVQLYTGKINGNKEKSPDDCIPTPKVQLYAGKIYVKWYKEYRIGAGLINLGNTCFMNTVIQCLTYCPPLANYLLHDNDHSSRCTLTGFCMMCILQKHMKKALAKTGDTIKPFEVHQHLKFIVKHFTYGRQEDAHEFLRYVIDHLWKSCLPQTNGVAKLDSASKETTVINKIFGGYHRSQVICLKCKKESNTYDHFMDFILDIKQNVVTLEKALEKFTQPELLQNDNCYKCPKCKMKVEAHKKFTVYKAPTVATFQLKRFDYIRSFGGKITKHITYPEKLNLRPYMSDTKGDPVWYRLNAVIVHSGPTCNSGHYYCYVRNSIGRWYTMDDQRVSETNINHVLNQSAYVLFYIKTENPERAPLKKCLDNKNTVIRGTLSNSHFSKVSEMSSLKSIPLSGKVSPFSSSKSNSCPSSIKKFTFSSPNREKISFGFRTNGSSTSLTSPKNKINSSESVSTPHSGLVPYMEDSSEASDASENDLSLSQNRQNSISNMDVNPMRNGSLESYQASPHLEIKAKSRLNPSIASRSTACSPAPKVNATGSWIVTDAPQTSSNLNTSSNKSVTSTTDWQVIETSDLKSKNSPKMNDNQDYSRRECSVSPKAFSIETSVSKHSANNIDQGSPSSSTKKLTGYDSSPSAQKCNFRKQIHKGKTHFPEDEATASNSFKRKSIDSYSKVSKDSSYFQYNENRHSPVSKKAKYTESSSFLNLESDVRNSSSHVEDSVNSSAVQKQHSVANCDTNSRTCVVNGVSSPLDSSRSSSSKDPFVLNGSSEMDKKDSIFSKGKQGNPFSGTKTIPFEKVKSPISNQGKNSFLYGTEVPTWREEEDHYRPSVVSAHENRRSFDDYDNEFDRGKVRKPKMKDEYQYFHRKNPFQKHADRYQGKYNGKFYNSHHNNKKYDSRPNWKSNHNYNYQRYRNHHRHY